MLAVLFLRQFRMAGEELLESNITKNIETIEMCVCKTLCPKLYAYAYLPNFKIVQTYVNLFEQAGWINLIGWKLEVGVASWYIQHDKG